MSKRGPALYELIGDRPVGKHADDNAPTSQPTTTPQQRTTQPRPARTSPAATTTRTPTLPHESTTGSDNPFAALAPGNTLRIPAVYLYFAAALLILVTAAAWTIGYSRGQSTERAAYEETLLADDLGLDPANDPLLVENTPNTPQPQQPTRNAAPSSTDNDPTTQANRPNQTATAQPNRSNADNRPAPVTVLSDGVADPREPGLNYYILASGYTREPALELASFVASRGVPTVVTSTRNGFYTVTTRSGISRDEYRAGNRPPRSTIEANVRNIGRAYRTAGGPTNFADAYWARID